MEQLMTAAGQLMLGRLAGLALCAVVCQQLEMIWERSGLVPYDPAHTDPFC